MAARHGIVIFVLVLALNLAGASWIATEAPLEAAVEELFEDRAVEPSRWTTTAVQKFAATLAQSLGFEGPSFLPPTILNAILGAVTAVLLQALMLSIGVRSSAAFVTTVLWALCWGPWSVSRTPDERALSLAPLLGAVFVLTRQRLTGAHLFLASALFSNAVALSPSNLWFFPAMIVAFVGRVRTSLAWAGGLGLLTLGLLPWFLVVSNAGPLSLAGTGHCDAGLAGPLGTLGAFLFRPQGGGAFGEVVSARWFVARDVLGALLMLVLAFWGAWTARGSRVALVAWVAILFPAVRSWGVLKQESPEVWLAVLPFVWILVAAKLSAHWDLSRLRDKLATGVVIASLYVANVANGPPTVLHPTGDLRWQRAGQLGQVLPHAALVMRPAIAASDVEFLTHFRSDIEVLDLERTPPTNLREDAYLSWFDESIRAALEEGREVLLAVTTSPSNTPCDPWVKLFAARGVTRTQVLELLDERFLVAPLDGLGDRWVLVRPRDPSELGRRI